MLNLEDKTAALALKIVNFTLEQAPDTSTATYGLAAAFKYVCENAGADPELVLGDVGEVTAT